MIKKHIKLIISFLTLAIITFYIFTHNIEMTIQLALWSSILLAIDIMSDDDNNNNLNYN